MASGGLYLRLLDTLDTLVFLGLSQQEGSTARQ